MGELNLNWVEYIGYGASFFIVLSFLIPNNIKLLRIINFIGCVLFVIYGYYIDSYPIIIPNIFIAFVQLYYLFIYKPKAT